MSKPTSKGTLGYCLLSIRFGVDELRFILGTPVVRMRHTPINPFGVWSIYWRADGSDDEEEVALSIEHIEDDEEAMRAVCRSIVKKFINQEVL